MTRGPAYLHCPFCDHPTLIPSMFVEEPHRCRQCGGMYRPARDGRQPDRDASQPLAPLPQRRRTRPRSDAPFAPANSRMHAPR